MISFKVISQLLMLVSIFQSSTLASQQNLRTLAREQARRDPSSPILLPSPPAELWPRAIGEIATDADVVLQARLARSKSYLDSKEDRIHTDYLILEPSVVAGRLLSPTSPAPGLGVPLRLTVWGGEAIVDGVTIRATDTNREPIKDGGNYLLFLKASPTREVGLYEIYYGAIFEIVEGAVTPLHKQAADVFKGTIDARLKDFVLRIQTAVRAAKGPLDDD
jgi:hypothetical protein